MDIDTVHDELVIPNPFAQAILFFRAGAKGEEPPIRMIQGPKTMLHYTDSLTVDEVHGEVYTPQRHTNSILVFQREPGGNVAPIRVIHGPKTMMDRPMSAAVDPVNHLVAVSGPSGLLIFNRTDNGDVAPKWVLVGPKTGLAEGEGANSEVALYPKGKKIIVAGGSRPDPSNRYQTGVPQVRVWNYGDNGNVAPWAVLTSSAITQLRASAGNLAINPEDAELIMTNSGGIYVFRIPELFQ